MLCQVPLEGPFLTLNEDLGSSPGGGQGLTFLLPTDGSLIPESVMDPF